MLDVTLDKLTTRTTLDLRAKQVRFGMNQGHRVLQLVTKTIGPPNW